MRMPSEEPLRTTNDIHEPLAPPSTPYLQPGPSLNNTPRGSYVDDASQPRDSAYTTADVTSPHASTPFLNENEKPATTASSSADHTRLAAVGAGAAGAGAAYEAEKAASTTDAAAGTRSRKRPIYKRPLFWLITAAAIIVVVLAVILPVYFKVIKPNNDNTSGASASGGGGGGGSGSNPSSPSGATTGGNGTSVIDSATGQTFTYTNQFGGFCECLLSLCAVRMGLCASGRVCALWRRACCVGKWRMFGCGVRDAPHPRTRRNRFPLVASHVMRHIVAQLSSQPQYSER